MKDKVVRWTVILLVALFTLICWPADPFDLGSRPVNIPKGSSIRLVQKILQDNGILPRFTAFRQVVRFGRLQRLIKAGDYAFSPADPLPRVIFKLAQGQTLPPKELRVTFPEGASIYRMALILKENGFEDWQRFQGLVDEGITARLREKHRTLFRYISSESLEGYLFPDTYSFFAAASAETLAERMVGRFEEMVLPFWAKAQRETRLSLHEILTLASIIEKEARRPEERPVIASVFYNRLNKGMPLAADPTIKYALARPSKRVFYEQLDIRSPYNTYKRRGLPPGPICNPGLESLKAAVSPARTNYFFFVAKKDGSHFFSKTWQEHQQARNKAR